MDKLLNLSPGMIRFPFFMGVAQQSRVTQDLADGSIYQGAIFGGIPVFAPQPQPNTPEFLRRFGMI